MRRRLTIEVKRIYEAPARSDGCRILVDRIWPRGISKDAAKLDAWLKDAAPSAELRSWFGHDPAKWASFKRKYFRELRRQDGIVEQLADAARGKTITLLFAAKDELHNNAVALKEYLDGQLGTRGERR
ncbi:MAG: DUF488 domain-containing protein [Deltaproteobacteria bacterium]|nr:DUF488 domain-containing protein [Deltaproteobacteria bacterium]